jgi:hypothetical protein
MTVSDVLAAIKAGQGFIADSRKEDAPSPVVPRPCGDGCHHQTIKAVNAVGEDVASSSTSSTLSRAMDQIDVLPDEVLLELGRLIWAVINLEDVVYEVCWGIEPRGGPFDDIPIGKRIDMARNDLKSRPVDALRAKADAWLVQAKDALMARNGVMHAVPVTFMPMAPHITPGSMEPMLAHFPKNKERPAVHYRADRERASAYSNSPRESAARMGQAGAGALGEASRYGPDDRREWVTAMERATYAARSRRQADRWAITVDELPSATGHSLRLK